MKAMELTLTLMPSFVIVPDGKGSWVSTSEGSLISKRLFEATGNRRLDIPAGVHNNLASIPRPARLLFPVNAPHRVAAYVHDYLYEVRGRLPDGRVLSRELCDQIFLDVMRTIGSNYLQALSQYDEELKRKIIALMGDVEKPLVGSFTAGTMYRAVRIGGGFAWAT